MFEESIYEEEIEQNNEICSNCFRRIKFSIEPPERIPSFVSDIQEYESHAESVWVEENKQVEGKADAGRPNVKRTACKCGCVSAYTKVDRPVKDYQKYSERIIERLYEEGFTVNESQFLDCVHSLKSDPDYQHKPEAIFNEATEFST
jgi:hypothetical protein